MRTIASATFSTSRAKRRSDASRPDADEVVSVGVVVSVERRSPRAPSPPPLELRRRARVQTVQRFRGKGALLESNDGTGRRSKTRRHASFFFFLIIHQN